MNYLYALSAVTILLMWARLFRSNHWLSVSLIFSLTAYIAYIPFFITQMIHAIGYNFTTVFQTLKFLLDNMGIGS